MRGIGSHQGEGRLGEVLQNRPLAQELRVDRDGEVLEVRSV